MPHLLPWSCYRTQRIVGEPIIERIKITNNSVCSMSMILFINFFEVLASTIKNAKKDDVFSMTIKAPFVSILTVIDDTNDECKAMLYKHILKIRTRGDIFSFRVC